MREVELLGADGYPEQYNHHSDSCLDVNVFAPLLSQPLSTSQIQQLSPSSLAYLGDAIYELYIRRYYLLPPKRPRTYHQQVVAQVRAERQAYHLRSLIAQLTPVELEILKRGRNAATGGPRRINPEVYQQATSLETLIGYLYLTDPQRLLYLFTQLQLDSLNSYLEPSQNS